MAKCYNCRCEKTEDNDLLCPDCEIKHATGELQLRPVAVHGLSDGPGSKIYGHCYDKMDLKTEISKVGKEFERLGRFKDPKVKRAFEANWNRIMNMPDKEARRDLDKEPKNDNG